VAVKVQVHRLVYISGVHSRLKRPFERPFEKVVEFVLGYAFSSHKAAENRFNFDRTDFKRFRKRRSLNPQLPNAASPTQNAFDKITMADHVQFKFIVYVLTILWDI
jgi:hypothetical protein